MILLEQARVGTGASAASAGFDAVESPDPRLRELAIRGRLLYQAMGTDVPEARVRRLRTLWVVEAAQASRFRGCFTGRAADYSAIEPCDPSMLPKGFTVPAQTCVFEDPHNGTANVRAVCLGIVRHLRARHRRFECREEAQVLSLDVGGEGCMLRLARGPALAARRVVIAAGAWLPGHRLSPFRPTEGALRVKKVASLCIDTGLPGPSAGMAGPPPAVVYGSHGAFFLPRADAGGWTFSFTLDAWDCAPEHGMALAPQELAQGLRQLALLAPSLRSRVTGAQVSCDAYTPDHLPRCAPLADAPHVIAITGCSGAGYRIAPALAQDALAMLMASH